MEKNKFVDEFTYYCPKILSATVKFNNETKLLVITLKY